MRMKSKKKLLAERKAQAKMNEARGLAEEATNHLRKNIHEKALQLYNQVGKLF